MNASPKPLETIEIETKKEGKGRKRPPQCTSLTWNALGKKLFAGFTDGLIRVYHINSGDAN